MGKTNSTFVRPVSWVAGLLVLAFMFVAQTSFAQTGDCGCQDQVNVTLGEDCTFELTLAQVGAGDCEDQGYRVVVNDRNPGNGATVDCAGLYTYGIFDSEDELVCWGEVLAEDKTAPIVDEEDQKDDPIECVYIDDLVNNENSIDPNHPLYIGLVTFADNCGDCGCGVDVKFFDRVEYHDCPDDAEFGDDYTYATMYRKWTATDCEGNVSDYVQEFEFYRPSLDDLYWPENEETQTCDIDGEDRDCPMPYWIGCFDEDGKDGYDRLYLDELECNYSVTASSTEFPICGGEGVKIECTYQVFDWCAEESQDLAEYLEEDNPIVKIGDFDAPEFKGNARNSVEYTASDEPGGDDDLYGYAYNTSYSTTLSTGPVDCTAAFSIDLEDLKATFGFDIEDCEIADYSVEIWKWGPEIKYGIPTGDTIWRETNFPMINGMAAGIPVGVYGLVIEAFDGCYNNAKGVTFFTVKDQISPVMKCDDDLNVTLSTGGYAKVFAEDIDEGSWDNCALESLHVRRAVPQECIDSGNFDMDDLVEEDGVFYTEWADYVEFFCCDLAADVLIELRGTDNAVDPWTGMAMPNTNICWMELTIEDKVQPICADLEDATTFCDDPALEDLSSFGTPAVPFSNCDNIEIVDLDPIEDLDRCGFGTITRQFQAVKNLGTDNESRSAICEQVINVVARHDYWVKFPADQAADCGNDVEINGVEFAEEACDLIAVSSTDERFFATQDPDACYKIFRTYRVINWCEYDGEAQPTIVSRDWDWWNGADCTSDYNVNPTSPDGDDNPGDEDIYVIVKRNFADGLPDTVYYDNDSDPSADNNSADDPTTTSVVEDYWWKVISGSDDPSDEDYYEGYTTCGTYSKWADDGNQTDSDISGNAQGDDNDYRYGSFGYWQYTQHIVVYDDVDPELTITGEDTFCSISNEDCAGPVNFSITATDLCTDDVEDVTITVRLDVGNDGTIDADVTDSYDAATGSFSSRYPQGQHRLVVEANDGCGNAVVEDFVFDVVDCKKPAPICINGLSIELMPSETDSTGAAMAVWASDFLASPIFDCNGQGEDGEVTKFSINRVGGEVDADQTGVTFNCEDAGQLIEVEVYAWDAVGNGDFCITTVQVDDNMGSCSTDEGEGGVAGAIATEENATVEGVEVQLSGARNMMYMTDDNGGFNFAGLTTGHDYTVTPQLDRAALNGVSTFDLVLISKHILGLQSLNSPYKMIAADVNNSKSITTLDLIQLRKLILNIDTEFSNNTSWRFVDATYSFRNPANPFAESFPEVKNINNLDGEEAANFVAVKVGDVNGNANVAEVRSLAGTFNMNVAEQEMKAGNEYTIDINAEDLTTVAGYQFTLNVANAEIVDVVSGIASEEHFGVFAKEGVITTSWNGEATEGTLFSVVVRAAADTKVSEVLTVSSRYTAAEAYNTADEVLGVALNVNGATATAANELFQNNPNPFKGETVIGFNLIDASEATITVQDVTGRILKVVEGDFAAGYNQVRLTSTDLPSTGVFYYTLEAGEYTATKKMIVVE